VSQFLRHDAPAIAYAVVIFIVSSLPSLALPDIGFSFEDKLAHLVEFGVFGFLLVRSLGSRLGYGFRGLGIVAIIGTGYAASDEWHQSFVPGREADVTDFFADVMGILLALALFWLYKRTNQP